MHEMASTTSTATNAQNGFYATAASEGTSPYRDMQIVVLWGLRPQQTSTDPIFTPTAAADKAEL